VEWGGRAPPYSRPQLPVRPTAVIGAPHQNHATLLVNPAFHLSGHLRFRMDDGTEIEYGPGDVGTIPPGHDAWVVGNEPVVIIDVTGFVNYAKQS
jgi:quercetin dioxygenase-like cupin family protein